MKKLKSKNISPKLKAEIEEAREQIKQARIKDALKKRRFLADTWIPKKFGKTMRFPDRRSLERDLIAYFEVTDPDKLTIVGLAAWLGVTLKTLDNYGKKQGYRKTVAFAKTLVEKAYEVKLSERFPTGAIFALKRFKWTDVLEGKVDTSDAVKEFFKKVAATPKHHQTNNTAEGGGSRVMKVV